MVTVKLSSGYNLQFDTLADVLAWTPAWELVGDDSQVAQVLNTKTGTIVGLVCFEGDE